MSPTSKEMGHPASQSRRFKADHSLVRRRPLGAIMEVSKAVCLRKLVDAEGRIIERIMPMFPWVGNGGSSVWADGRSSGSTPIPAREDLSDLRVPAVPRGVDRLPRVPGVACQKLS